MIDDATLIANKRYADMILDRQCPSPSECQDPCQTDHSFALAVRLLETIAEIQRLREWNYTQFELCAGLKATLAAHLVVIRELADLLDVDALPEFANEGDMIAWVGRKQAALAHPLVQQAWEEKASQRRLLDAMEGHEQDQR